jgi:uncharacterized protein (TIGR02145 family)
MEYAASMDCDPCGSNGVQGICPPGFHIPTDLEWSRYEWCVETTIAPVGNTPLSTFQNTGFWRGSTTPGVGPGDKMKAANPYWNGTNASGFGARAAGQRHSSNGAFPPPGNWGIFLSATLTQNSDIAIGHAVVSYEGRSFKHSYAVSDGLSVRCLKDN